MNLSKNSRRLIVASLLLTLTQTGCLCGIAVWPLWIVGSAVTLTGASIMGVGMIHQYEPYAHTGLGIAILGSILGEENTLHIEAFNEIPRDLKLAHTLSVSLDDLSDYNDNLNQIQTLGNQIIKDLQPLMKRIRSNEITPSQIISDPQINELARRYGFGSAAELMTTRSSTVLPHAYLNSFARSTGLSVVQAKIFLYYAFRIESN